MRVFFWYRPARHGSSTEYDTGGGGPRACTGSEPTPGIARGSRSCWGRPCSRDGAEARFTAAARLEDHRLTLPARVPVSPKPSASQSPLLESAPQPRPGDGPPSSPNTFIFF